MAAVQHLRSFGRLFERASAHECLAQRAANPIIFLIRNIPLNHTKEGGVGRCVGVAG